MAEATAETQEHPSDDAKAPTGETPQGEEKTGADIDWKAMARKWEDRAKSNKQAADELEQLKQAQMTEQQKAEAKAEKLQRKLETLEHERQISQWKSGAAKTTGLPAAWMDVLHGESEEDFLNAAKFVTEHASDLDRFIRHQPHVSAPAETNHPLVPSGGAGDWLRDAFKRK